jgi:hypothetical protein
VGGEPAGQRGLVGCTDKRAARWMQLERSSTRDERPLASALTHTEHWSFSLLISTSPYLTRVLFGCKGWQQMMSE